jgi:hypothetical protein
VTRSSMLLWAAILAAGCAPAMRTATTPVPLMPRRTIDSQVRTARLALDSAVRKGDLESLRGWLADDAVIVTGADTLRGRDAISLRLAALWPGATARVTFGAGRTEYCVDGMYEDEGGYTAFIHVSVQREDTLHGAYALLWRRSDDGVIRIRGVSLGAFGKGASPRVRGCELATARIFDAHRMRVSLFIPGMPATSNTASSLTQRLVEQGYGPDVITSGPAGNPSTGIRPTITGAAPWPIVGLRVRPWGGLSIEGLLVLATRSDAVTGVNGRTGSVVTATASRSQTVAAVVGYEWRRLRLGAGPFFSEDAWSVREWHIVPDPVMGWDVSSSTPIDSWKERRAGLLLEAAYTIPVAPYLFVELRGQDWSVASRMIHGAGQFAPAYVDTSGWILAVATGVAF